MFWNYNKLTSLLDNVNATAILKGQRRSMKGKEYIIFDKIDVDLYIADAEMYFDNIFENNAELTAATNNAINENIHDILAEMQPVIKKTLGEIVLTFIGTLFRRYSVDELFPAD